MDWNDPAPLPSQWRLARVNSQITIRSGSVEVWKWAMAIAAVLAVVFEVLRLRTKGRFPLSAVSIGLGVVLPPESCLAMWLGAMLFWYQGRTAPAPGTRAHAIWIEGAESICAGLISGAALVGIGNAIVNVLLLRASGRAVSWGDGAVRADR